MRRFELQREDGPKKKQQKRFEREGERERVFHYFVFGCDFPDFSFLLGFGFGAMRRKRGVD